MRALVRSLLLVTFALVAVAAASADEYSLVRVYFDGPGDAARLVEQPGLDIAQVKPGQGADLVATPATMATIEALGLRYEVVEKDLVAHYASRITRKDDGNFGLWHTYSESQAFVDSLRMRFPEVVSERWSIGQTHEGRDIWCFRVSDNPDVDEDEPEILLDAMHHAREIMAGEFTIMFAEYLAENYGTDPVLTWLVDNRELYIVPMVNPDGIVYNELTDPQGGGMWRKNRRDNGGSYGVDINRNYPFMWGYDNIGSSPYPYDETYRGPSAGSEPETQALMNLVNAHAFVTHQTMHTYGGQTLFPWGYTSSPAPDADIFEHIGQVMTMYNGYEYGPPGQILYPVNGNTFDWAYGTADVFCVSNEVGGGGDGFWPDESRRGALFQENIWPMTYLMMAAGPYVRVDGAVATDADGGLLEPGDEGEFWFTVSNEAVNAGLTGVDVRLATSDPYVQILSAQRTIADLGAMASVDLSDDPIGLVVDPACPDGHLVTIEVTADWGAGTALTPLAFMVGSPNTVFTDDFTLGTGNWTLQGGWGQTGTAHSPPTAITDSPSGDYQDGAFATATLNQGYHAAQLGFWHRYDIEDGWDYGRVQISADGGPWNTVQSFTGYQSSWQQAEIDLSQYAGQLVRVRFVLESDSWITEDGWYVDDVMLLGAGSENQTPAGPLPVAPVGGAQVGATPQLVVANSSDPDSPDALTYGFRVYGDEDLTELVASTDGLGEGTGGETAWTVADALPQGDYWWRAYAADSEERGLLGPVASFTVTGVVGIGDGVVIGGPQLAVLGGGRLKLTLPSTSDVSVRVYNARGLRIRDLYTGTVGAGERVLVWDGRDQGGRQAASGVYFVRVVAGGEALTGRVVLVR